MSLFAWQHNTVSQAGTPRHDNCVQLPVSWLTISYKKLKPALRIKTVVIKTHERTYTKRNTHEKKHFLFYLFFEHIYILFLLNLLQTQVNNAWYLMCTVAIPKRLKAYGSRQLITHLRLSHTWRGNQRQWEMQRKVFESVTTGQEFVENESASILSAFENRLRAGIV